MWNIKSKTGEYSKKERDSQIKRTNWWLSVGGGEGRGLIGARD